MDVVEVWRKTDITSSALVGRGISPRIGKGIDDEVEIKKEKIRHVG
jgi:hypothetical protein